MGGHVREKMEAPQRAGLTAELPEQIATIAPQWPAKSRESAQMRRSAALRRASREKCHRSRPIFREVRGFCGVHLGDQRGPIVMDGYATFGSPAHSRKSLAARAFSAHKYDRDKRPAGYVRPDHLLSQTAVHLTLETHHQARSVGHRHPFRLLRVLRQGLRQPRRHCLRGAIPAVRPSGVGADRGGRDRLPVLHGAVMAVALCDRFGGVLLAACHAPCQELPRAVWAAGDLPGSRPPGRCRGPRPGRLVPRDGSGCPAVFAPRREGSWPLWGEPPPDFESRTAIP
jgi:hypothetical protein